MLKRLISKKYRGGGTALLAIVLLFVGIETAVAAISCQKANWTGFVSCTSPEAAICNGTQSTFVQECADLGFGSYVGEGEHCVDPSCSTPIGTTPVPELEDYAAAAFLGFALLTGWRIRGRRRTAG